MGKQRIDIEYPLTTKSPNIIWDQISSAHGLGRWIADHVSESADGHMTFTWGEPWTENHTQTAVIVEREKHSHVKFRWIDDEDQDAYWEMRIGRSELTDHLNLMITDYAWEEDVDDLRELWDGNLERLHRASGL